jgi:adenine phosphoribosyltransferase
MDTYTLTICGLTRELPIVHISQKTRLANFSFLGDVELVDRLADEFATKLKTVPFDYIVVPHVKAVPLAHGVAKRLGHRRFIVCRKSVKPYMIRPHNIRPLSHFPKHAQPIAMNGTDAELLKGKRVVVIDDVVSTGVTLRMMKKLLTDVGAILTGCFVVIKQGDNLFEPLENLTYLAKLPIFKDPERSS